MTWEEILALPAIHIPQEKIEEVIKNNRLNSKK